MIGNHHASVHPSDPAGTGWTLPRMFGRSIVLGIVVAILLVGFGATAVLHRQSEQEVSREESDLVMRSARVLEASSGALAASLAGASAVVDPSGSVDELTFEAFAAGAVSTTRVSVLAFVPLVEGDQRDAFEATAGLTITQPGANGLVTADERAAYLPVQFVHPRTDTSRSVIGFDTASDPTRLATATAALETGGLVFSPPLPSQPTGETSVFFAQPLFPPGSVLDSVEARRTAIVGFATGLTPSRTILSSVLDQLPSRARVSIVDGEELLAASERPPTGGSSMEIVQAGRTWTVTVQYDEADHGATWLMLVSTLVLAGAVGFFLLRNFRQTRDLRLAASTVRELGRLSERLATAADRDQMIDTILANAGSMVGASAVAVALWSGDDHLVRSSSDGSSERSLADRTSPVGAAVVDGVPVWITDGAALRAAFPTLARRQPSAVEAVVALPLRRPNGEVMGAIEWSWQRANRLRADVRSTLLTTAEVCQQSIHRDEVQQNRWRSALALSELSQRLSVSRNLDQIAEILVRHGAQASGADHVAVGFISEHGTELRIHHPSLAHTSGRTENSRPDSFTIPIDPSGELMAMLRLGEPIHFEHPDALRRFPEIHALVGDRLRRMMCMSLIDADGQLRGVVGFVYLSGSASSAAEVGRLDTIVDLTAQTVERSLLYQHEHELVINLQQQTLADLPDVDGLRVSARYLPASSLLGLGGDWYDMYVLDDGRIGIVVGDVAGHGIDAIADMTEFRTTISTLLRTSVDLGRIPAMSTALLNDVGRSELRFATAGLMILDQNDAALSFVRAGHPPAMVRRPDGTVVVLEQVGGAPIGIETTSVAEHRLDLVSGSVLVGYTDGLIERREESIDVGLARLADALAECDSTDPDVIADTLITRCHGGRQTDDDTAVLVIVVD